MPHGVMKGEHVRVSDGFGDGVSGGLAAEFASGLAVGSGSSFASVSVLA